MAGMQPTAVDWEPLLAAATAIRQHAYAPYSGFRVGAALLAEDGRIYAGCNVENRSFGLAVCAERSAAAQAVAAGAGRPLAAAVVADTSPPARPCGMCLETLSEFAPDLPILLANLAGEREVVTLRSLLPQPFRWPGNRRGA
jgi:cytidine deaminase